MSDVLGIAEAAMRNSAERLETVSRNVAHASAHGFKREVRVQAPFDAQLQQARDAAIHRDLSTGKLQYTGKSLHFALEGSGWFQVQTPHGVLLTRDGNFRTDAEGRLVTTQGWPVLMDGDVRLTSEAVSLRSNHELWDSTERLGAFALAEAPAESMQPAGVGLFRSAQIAALEPGHATLVRQGYLEGSNVDSLTEMVTMMESLRQAEAAQRMMRAYDEALGTALTTLGEF